MLSITPHDRYVHCIFRATTSVVVCPLPVSIDPFLHRLRCVDRGGGVRSVGYGRLFICAGRAHKDYNCFALLVNCWLTPGDWTSGKRSYLRDRLKNTLKPMKWNIFHFSLDPPPLRNEIPSYCWLHSMMVNTSPEANFCWKSEIVTMKSPTPSPLVKNISLHWLQGIFETVPYVDRYYTHPGR